MKLQGVAAAKALIPVALFGFGGLAWASGPTEAAAGEAQSWIDSPMPGATLDVSILKVSAHATADTAVTSFELEVDGKVESSAEPIASSNKLAYATLSWNSKPGSHSLRVRGKSSDGWGPFSDSRTIVIGPALQPEATSTVPIETTTTIAVPEATVAVVETTTTLESTTTTTIGTAGTVAPKPSTPAPTPVPKPNPVPTQPPPTAPPAPAPTAPPTTAAPPIIDSAVLSGNPILYRPTCFYSAQVTARIRNASSARVTIDDIGFDAAMAKNGDDFTITIPSGFASTSTGVKAVRVIATGPGGTVQASAGTIEIRFNCPKD